MQGLLLLFRRTCSTKWRVYSFADRGALIRREAPCYTANAAQEKSEMSRLPLRTVENAPDGAKLGVQAALKNNGFLPNLIGLLANSPVALETYQTVSAINARSDLRLAEREAVQITAAAIHGCGFCVAGHTAIAYKKIGLNEAVVDALRAGRSVPDARLDAVATFTKAVIRSRGNVSDDELAAFRTAGFNDANALEVVLGVSLATLCNFANNLGRPPLNPELAQYAWNGPAAEAAE
jgi:AhpD family alkylhydroperoxidase